MAKSTAVSEAQARELKEKLERRGFTVSESKVNGYAKLTLDTNDASIVISQEDQVSKDVFGNDLDAYTPHKLVLSFRTDGVAQLGMAKIMIEIGKIGMKILVKEHATVLATAEAIADSAAEVIEFDSRWKGKGI